MDRPACGPRTRSWRGSHLRPRAYCRHASEKCSNCSPRDSPARKSRLGLRFPRVRSNLTEKPYTQNSTPAAAPKRWLMLGACHFLYSGRDIANRRYAMKTRVLGSTGIAISRVALGCGSFGGIGSPKELVGRGLDEAESFATMDEAVALGINLFDTAHAYAQGASEKMLGRWL